MERRNVIYFSNPVWENAAYLHPYDASVIGYKDMNTGNLVWTDPYGNRDPIPGGTQVTNALRVSPDDPESLQRARILDIARKNETHARRADNGMRTAKTGFTISMAYPTLFGLVAPTLAHKHPGGFWESLSNPYYKKLASKHLGWKWSDPKLNYPFGNSSPANGAGELVKNLADSSAASGSDAVSAVTDAVTNTDPSAVSSIGAAAAAGASAVANSGLLSSVGSTLSSILPHIGSALTAAGPYLGVAATLALPTIQLIRWNKMRKQKKKALEEAKKARELLGMKNDLGDDTYKYYQNEGLYADNPMQYLNYRPDRGVQQLKFA